MPSSAAPCGQSAGVGRAVLDVDLPAGRQRQAALLVGAVRPERAVDLVGDDRGGHLLRIGRIHAARRAQLRGGLIDRGRRHARLHDEGAAARPPTFPAPPPVPAAPPPPAVPAPAVPAVPPSRPWPAPEPHPATGAIMRSTKTGIDVDWRPRAEGGHSFRSHGAMVTSSFSREGGPAMNSTPIDFISVSVRGLLVVIVASDGGSSGAAGPAARRARRGAPGRPARRAAGRPARGEAARQAPREAPGRRSWRASR